MFNGKIHYFDWAMFNSKPLNYQRVAVDKEGYDISLPKGLKLDKDWKRALLAQVAPFKGLKGYGEIPNVP